MDNTELEVQTQPQADLMDYETFKRVNENLNKVVLNTIAILEGCEKLDVKNIAQYLEEIRQDALVIAGEPLTQERVQEMVDTINNALDNALAQIQANGGVDTKAIMAEIQTKLQEAQDSIQEKVNSANTQIDSKLNEVNALLGDIGKGFDYIENENPKGNTNPTKDNALWLNARSGFIFICIDKTTDNNVWHSSQSILGGIFDNFQPKDPDSNTEGAFYVNTATNKAFVKHQDVWVEISEVKSVADITTETLAEGILYLQGNDLFYMDSTNPVHTLDSTGNGAPQSAPNSDYAIYYDVENGFFYICTNAENNVWEKMEYTNTPDVPNIITKPSTEVRPSEPGFGGGLASDKALKRLGLEKLSGTEDRESTEYANYIHKETGSIMHYTPAMYHKLSFESGAPYYGLKVEFSKEKKEGFVLNRSFINNGQIVEGVFMDKFINSIKNGKNVSVKDGIPASLNNSYQPISQLGVAMNFGGCIDAAKKRGGTFLEPKWVRDYYILLMLAKYQKCYDEGKLYDLIAWANTTPHVVRGCNNGALSDHNDNTIKYAATGDGRGGKTGGVSTELDLKKISILGDGASPVDFNGVMYEVMFGLNGNGGKLGMLKNGVDIQGLTSKNAFTTDYYDYFTLPFSGAGFYGNGSEQVLECATEQDTDAWRRDCLLIPKAKYGSSAEIFGGDSVTLAAPEQCMPSVGANWNAAGAYGALLAYFTDTAGSGYISHGYHDVGFRACALGEALR